MLLSPQDPESKYDHAYADSSGVKIHYAALGGEPQGGRENQEREEDTG